MSEADLCPGPEEPPAPRGGLPGIGRQKSFITENASILDRGTKLAILNIVMMEVGPSVATETGGAREVDVDLDALAELNPEVLAHIYNIVKARLGILNQPAGPGPATLRRGGAALPAREQAPQ